MKRISALILALLPLLAAAQTRTLSDIEAKAYVIGLDSYIYGSPGNLEFDLGSSTVTVNVDADGVYVGGKRLCGTDGGEILVGTHDFTGNRECEIMVASRSAEGVRADVFSWSGSAWRQVGRMAVPSASEIRIFRQAVSIKKPSSGALCTWTWHNTAFDFKSSDGEAEPSF